MNGGACGHTDELKLVLLFDCLLLGAPETFFFDAQSFFSSASFLERDFGAVEFAGHFHIAHLMVWIKFGSHWILYCLIDFLL